MRPEPWWYYCTFTTVIAIETLNPYNLYMIITGFQKTTLLDYPEHVAATIFTKGCNLRCPFCHNGNLVLNEVDIEAIPEEEVLSVLRKRSGVLEGVCVSGGEPTLQPDLPLFLEKVKALGLLVKLDTNGSNPAILKELVGMQLVDYVAMDIKAGRDNYTKACGFMNKSHVLTEASYDNMLQAKYIDIFIDSIKESAGFLLSDCIEYEFRTTVVKGIHTKADFADIRDWLPGAKRYFLQSYAESDGVIDKSCEAFSKDELMHFRDIVAETIPSVMLRGID